MIEDNFARYITICFVLTLSKLSDYSIKTSVMLFTAEIFVFIKSVYVDICGIPYILCVLV